MNIWRSCALQIPAPVPKKAATKSARIHLPAVPRPMVILRPPLVRIVPGLIPSKPDGPAVPDIINQVIPAFVQRPVATLFQYRRMPRQSNQTARPAARLIPS